MPDAIAIYRLLAFPNSIALIGVGYSLWLTTHTDTEAPADDPDNPLPTAAGVE